MKYLYLLLVPCVFAVVMLLSYDNVHLRLENIEIRHYENMQYQKIVSLREELEEHDIVAKAMEELFDNVLAKKDDEIKILQRGCYELYQMLQRVNEELQQKEAKDQVT